MLDTHTDVAHSHTSCLFFSDPSYPVSPPIPRDVKGCRATSRVSASRVSASIPVDNLQPCRARPGLFWYSFLAQQLWCEIGGLKSRDHFFIAAWAMWWVVRISQNQHMTNTPEEFFVTCWMKPYEDSFKGPFYSCGWLGKITCRCSAARMTSLSRFRIPPSVTGAGRRGDLGGMARGDGDTVCDVFLRVFWFLRVAFLHGMVFA